MSFIYHERQLGGLCGVHCLNNLLQGPHFGPGDLAEIGVQLDAQERMLMQPSEPQAQGEAAAPQEGYNVDSSADGGNFSIQVLSVALSKFKLDLLPHKHPRGRDLMKDPAAATEAFMCQYRDHWFAVRQVASCWWNLNSTRRAPAMVGDFYLAAWLAQLSAEGYSIFFVVGEKLPEPMKPSEPAHAERENFHDVFALLEQGKTSGGNPLAGGESEPNAADAALAAELMEQDLAAAQQPPQPTGLYEELVRAQLQVARPAAQAAALLQDSGWAPPGVVVPPSGWSDGSGWALWPGLAGGGGGGSLPSSAGRQPRAGGDELSPQALLEMGFKEPEVRAAQDLAGLPGSAPPLQLLLRVQRSDVAALDGEALARAIQQAILSLDAPNHTAFGEHLMRAIALLSLGEAKSRTAEAHLNCKALLEFYRLVLRNSGRTWPPQTHAAATVLSELLANFPVGVPSTGIRRLASSTPPPRPPGDDNPVVPPPPDGEGQLAEPADL